MLHAVEDGLVTLIGATTENPYFEVNSALLSRCTVIELQALSDEELVDDPRARRCGARRRTAPATCSRSSPRAPAATRAPRCRSSSSRRRPPRPKDAPLTEEHVLDASRKRPLLYDRKGDQHYDFASAFIKSMRGGDADASVYYLAAMLEAGEDPRFIARRMVILASEDVGNADPNALVVAVAAAQALEHVGLPEAQLNLSQAAIYLARAPKSNASAVAIWEARARRARARERAPAGDAPLDRPHACRQGAWPRRGLRLPARRRRPASTSRTSRRSFAGDGTIGRPVRERSRRMAVRTGDAAPEFDLEVAHDERVRLSELPRAAPTSSSSSTPSPSRRSARTRRATSRRTSSRSATPGRRSSSSPAIRRRRAQAWKAELGAEYTFASDFWPHGAAAKAYGVFNESNGAPHRGTFLIDRDGTVIWSLVSERDERRDEMVPESLDALAVSE